MKVLQKYILLLRLVHTKHDYYKDNNKRLLSFCCIAVASVNIKEYWQNIDIKE